MDINNVLILIATGAFAGFAGGMLGLGGAFIMTPLQYMVYTNMGLSADVAIKTAFGTSLLVVLTTAISGAWRHNRHGEVNWRLAVIMGSAGLVFSLIGSTLAAHINGDALKIVFGVIAIASCVRMIFTIGERREAEPVNNPWIWIAWAVPIGLLSGLLGVGGGVLMVPVMVVALKFKINTAAANSLAVMIITSIGGIIGYIINGIGAPGRLHYSVGYIDLPSWALLAIPAAVLAQVGAVTAHRISRRWLTYIFIVLMLYIGLRMIGVFKWLGWPL
jgi:uncharacterized membrane protein YfcA